MLVNEHNLLLIHPTFALSTEPPEPRPIPSLLQQIHTESMKSDWTPTDIPDLEGKIAVVTGSNIGLGLEIAKRLSEKRAEIILACRNVTKAENARMEIIEQVSSNVKISVMQVDTSSLESVRRFCSEFQSKYTRLDILMLNAGVMALQERKESVDGFEMQFATNHLGHFLMTGLLLPVLTATEGSRVVTQSSSANWFGKFNWDDLNAVKKYSRWDQYCFTKLANVAFANELNKRIADAGKTSPTAFSVHPGFVVGQLQSVSAGESIVDKIMYKVFGMLAGTYETGARPALYACAGVDSKMGEFYGPNGIFRGLFNGDHPAAVKPNSLAGDKESIEKLWNVSEELTKFKVSI